MIAASIVIAALALSALITLTIINRNIRVDESDRERAARITRELKGDTTGSASHSRTHRTLAERLSRLASEAGFNAKVSEVVFVFLGFCLVDFALGYLAAGMLFAAACALCTPVIMVVFLRAKATSRAKVFDRQFSSALMMVSQSMTAGMTAETAFSSVAHYAPEPLKGELTRMSTEVKFGGVSLDEALSRVARRTGSTDVAFLATATRVQKIGGGRLTGVLKSTARKIEARIRLRGLVDSVTSSARWTSKIVAAVPFLVLGALVFGAPDIGKTFWESTSWLLVIATIAILDALGLFIMRRLYKIRVE